MGIFFFWMQNIFSIKYCPISLLMCCLFASQTNHIFEHYFYFFSSTHSTIFMSKEKEIPKLSDSFWNISFVASFCLNFDAVKHKIWNICIQICWQLKIFHSNFWKICMCSVLFSIFVCWIFVRCLFQCRNRKKSLPIWIDAMKFEKVEKSHADIEMAMQSKLKF